MATFENMGREATLVRDGTKTATRIIVVGNCATESAALDAVYAKLCTDIGADPPDYDDLSWWDISAKEEAKNVWRCAASWKRYSSPSGETQFSFEIAVENTRVLVPAGNISVYKLGSAPALSLSLIGDRCDGRDAEGCEISIPTYRESETHWRGAGAIDAIKAAAKALVGKTNNDTWKGHSAGEALLLGVSGSRSGLGDWQLSFEWAVRPNQTGLTVGGVTGINKNGWDYLWPISAIQGSEIMRRVVTHVGVAPVYFQGDFDALGIG
ncbi:hypothetical protein SH661x_001942 [Planctomicrobium sp. SH661]|uniref:hypothetical protein n=1 Tax=Planctomicrobium sp. SH661 TaxID=3448124 RepID=UPI003F5C7B52